MSFLSASGPAFWAVAADWLPGGRGRRTASRRDAGPCSPRSRPASRSPAGGP